MAPGKEKKMPFPLLAAGATRLMSLCSSKVLSQVTQSGAGPRGLNSLLDAGSGKAGKFSPMDMLGNLGDIASLIPGGGGGGGQGKSKSSGTSETGL